MAFKHKKMLDPIHEKKGKLKVFFLSYQTGKNKNTR